LQENFTRRNYLSCRRPDKKDHEESLEDNHPEIREKLLVVYQHLSNNDRYTPNEAANQKFILASRKFVDFFDGQRINHEVGLDFLAECMKKNYVNLGKNVYPGNLCSDHTWEILMPQYLVEIG
jgi:hypothetical protein